MNTLVNNAFADDTVLEHKSDTKELERQLIKSLAGNYRVNFKFAETFSPITDYEYHDRYFSSAKEVVLLLKETDDLISLQHILYVGQDVIKHWRQDWIYENREFLQLDKGHHWKKTRISAEEAKGTWTQKVYQVDDAPRYEGYGTWIHADGRHYWESTADAALPRREITKRSDYNVLRRHSHIEIFEDGSWVIEQDNEKINRTGEGDQLICWEKGMETFTPKSYDASIATNWWKENESFWRDVRDVWQELRENSNSIQVQEDAALYMAQFELSKQFSGANYASARSIAEIKNLLGRYVTTS